MPRGTTLVELREMLRSEIGASPSVAMGVNTLNQIDHTLRRVQERLWSDHDWDFGYIERDEPLFNGQRYYTFDPEIDYDRIISTHVSFSDIWHPVDYGIGTNEYNQFDSERNQRTEPVLRWRHYEGNQFEVWPVPTSFTQKLRFKAIKKLPPLIAEGDRAELDDNLIVLFSAAEFLARSKAEDAQAKLAQANSHYNRLKGMGMKRDRFIYGGGIDRNERLRIVGGRFVRDDRI
jgi:hypothetical protein